MKNLFLLLLTFCIALASTQAFSAKLYRWKDANGEIYFSDKVPPSEAKKERATLNEKGRAIEIRDAQMSPQQLAQLKKIEALKKAQRASLKKQRAEDTALLKTFQSTSDIESLTAGKLEMLDSQIKIISSQSNTLKNQLIKYQKNAASYERSGKKVSKKTISNINSAQSQYDKNQSEIKDLNEKKIWLANQLKRDTKRFELLAQNPINDPTVYSSGTISLSLGEISCEDTKCDELWGKASTFVKKHVDTKITFESDSLILSASPKQTTDKTLALFAKENGQGSNITLDIQCLNTIKGREVCRSSKTKQLVRDFNNLNNY